MGIVHRLDTSWSYNLSMDGHGLQTRKSSDGSRKPDLGVATKRRRPTTELPAGETFEGAGAMSTLLDDDLAITKLAELIGRIRIAMLTTVTHEGSLRSRPIMTRQAGVDGDIWFFTKLRSAMTTEISECSGVSLSYARPAMNTYVSISGTAERVNDPATTEELWDPTFEKWFQGRPSDLLLVLTRVKAARAEYWNDSSTPGSLESGSIVHAPEHFNDPAFHAELAASRATGPVIVSTGACLSCHTHHARTYHRSFPTTFGEGETPAEAACDLIRLLSTQRDALVDRWHCLAVERAIADIRAFLEGAV
jgi:general stress protein 26